MIYLTGDTHIPLDVSKLNAKNFPEQKNLTRQDYVIVLGDFGLLWHKNKTYKYWLDILSKKNFTLLWLDGNHENHEWINSLPVTEWNGGRVHQIAPNIIHLMRGEVLCIDHKSIFVCGGAKSMDTEHRNQGVDWWPNEMLSYQDIHNATVNLEKVHNKVDYILTHNCPGNIAKIMFNVPLHNDTTMAIFDIIMQDTNFKKWYFGHWHKDIDYANFSCLYNRIIKLGD